jgi:hypothetical protein
MNILEPRLCSLGDMAILMLDKLSLCAAKVIIHRRLCDKFDLVVYYHALTTIWLQFSINFHHISLPKG